MTSSSTQKWVLGVAAAASFVVALDALVVTTALGTIRTDLQASLGQLEWTVNAYILALAVLMLTGAALGDRFGRRRMFAAGLGVFAAASAACALAPGVGWLIAARAVQGAGAALVMPLGLALLGAAFAPAQRARAIGIFASVTSLAVLCGPLLGGAVVQGVSWPWIFWLNVPVALALIPAALTRVEESHGPDSALDGAGVALATAATLGIVWALVRGNSAGWGSREVIAGIVAGLLAGAGFVAWERRTAAPMLPPALFRSRAFSAANAAMFFWWASGLGTLFFMAQFLQDGLGYDPLATGLRLMPWGAATFVAALVAGRTMARVGERAYIAGGLSLHAACMAWIALVASPDLAYWEMVLPLVLSGAGVAVSVPAIQSAVLRSVRPEHIGKASGTLSALRQLGGVFGVAALAAVFAGAGGYGSPQAFVDGFVPALALAAVLALAGALAAVLVPGRRLSSSEGWSAHAAPATGR
jgi:EmrB/QacA subfamily drug resistance transporter